ncbi:hypothetical protein M9H77_35888 [Catharanthus roseus]|uniref:Uncharacterized protein n=1 Tax=Catharanthus roseus TaxID=4058 RepID=A0ACB9ZS64_CATRO|nr:hypothetical protein M9H77_35888 [Catharanthus roseus]
MPLEHFLIQVAASNVIPLTEISHGAFFRSFPSLVYFIVATLMEKIVGPLSTGSLRLAAADVKVNPIVRFNYFQILTFYCQQCFGPRDFRYVGPSLPADLSNNFLMEEFSRRCLVGKIVDRNFRVFGVDPLKMQRTPVPYFMNGQFEMPLKRFACESPIKELDYDHSVVPMEKPLRKSC